jgi:hypothetical protein
MCDTLFGATATGTPMTKSQIAKSNVVTLAVVDVLG